MIEVPFGSPNAGDATARREKRIKNAAKRRNVRLERASEIINRPEGSRTDLTKDERLLDWEMRTQDPNKLVEELGQMSQVYGPLKASYQMLKWSNEMQKLAGLPHYKGEK